MSAAMPSDIAEGVVRPAVACDPTLIPAALRERPQWVCWEYIYREGKQTKCPMNARRGGKADSTNPATWASFDEAVAAWKANAYAGIGYVFGADDRFCGIDLDDCVETSGTLSPEALKIIRDMNSYTEYSPSGTGVKIFVRSTKNTDRCSTSSLPGMSKIEIFDEERYFTVTGRHLPGTPTEVQERQEQVDALCQLAFPPEASPKRNAAPPGAVAGDDQAIIDKIRRSAQAGKFDKLFAGDTSEYDNDASRADLALCSILAFWCGRNPAWMDRIFRTSGLYRAKWERTDYRERTLHKAIVSCGDVYDTSPRHQVGGALIAPFVGGSLPSRAIVLGTDEHRVVNEVVEALVSDSELYQRGNKICRIVIEEAATEDGDVARSAGASRIALVAPAYLRERITQHAALKRRGEKGIEPAHPPIWLVPEIMARESWPGLRNLVSVSGTPVLRPDGSVWSTSGFDEQTGVAFIPSCEYPPLPCSPGLDDARAAAESLLEVIHDFRFVSAAHKSAWMAAAVTPLVRSAFSGPVPLFLFDANVRGAGKTMLVQCVGELTQGRTLPVCGYTQCPEELRKKVTSIAIAGDPVVLFDNIDGPFGNGTLDRLLTSTRWTDRLLAKNEMVDLPIRTVWYATGNNIELAADTVRRVVHCRLDVLEQRPEERTGFKHPHLIKWVREQRARLVVGGLTIVAAYCRAGRPPQSLTPMGSFEGWSDLVRCALVWTGMPDPCETRESLAAISDTGEQTTDQLLQALEMFDPHDDGIVVADLVTRCWGSGGVMPNDAASIAVRAALENFKGVLPGKVPSPRVVAFKFRGVRRRCIDGVMLDTDPEEKRSAGAVWRVHQVRKVPPL
jgi:hypothetical protein